MCRPALVKQALRMGTAVLLVIALTATCRGHEESKPRPLPEVRQELRPGHYRSEEFEPSYTFRVGGGWSNFPPETEDDLAITWGDAWWLHIFKPYQVYKPSDEGMPIELDTPEAMVGWFRRHPYLKTSKPRPVTVGGVEGKRFDVLVAKHLPEDYLDGCGSDCMKVIRLKNGTTIGLTKGDKARLTVLEEVEDETVTIGVVAPAAEFELFAPKAQKVIATVEWRST